ncbi:MAG TPA: glycosyltransferase family 1 protein [Gammaproteobacteria bacterium]|nr:glycosyltransferase family 1 protein [Gammaproteobacteria bacterium]
MKVCHVTRQFHPAIGGIETVVWHLCQNLKQQGCEVFVITLDRLFDQPSKKLPATEVVDGIQVQRVPYRGPRQYAIAPTVLKYIRDCDVIHLHSSDFFLDWLTWTKWIHAKPIVLSTHGLYFHTPFARRLKEVYFRTMGKINFSLVDTIVCDSQQDFDLLSDRAYSKLRLIPNGIDFETLAKNSAHERDPDLILAVGRLASNKRYDRMLKTFQLVVRQRPSARLVIVGPDWGELSDLQKLAQDLDIGNSVSFTGPVSSQELHTLLHQANVWLSSSEYESFGVALLEAMAAKCVPIVHTLPAFQQLVEDNVQGFFVDFDESALAAATILGVLELPSQKRRQVVTNAQLQAAKFNWHNIAQKFLLIYEEVVEKMK